MSPSLALFALFTIGSAMGVPCVLNSVVGDHCTADTGIIGKCAGAEGSMTCGPSTITCTEKEACSQGPLKGKCQADNKCKYAVAPCLKAAAEDSFCVGDDNLLGTCKGTAESRSCTASNTCTLNSPCTSGGFVAMCETGNRCRHTPPMVPCLKRAASCTDSTGLIGTCTGSNEASMTCAVPTVVAGCEFNGTAGKPCAEGTLQGMCAPTSKCKYVPNMQPCSKREASCVDSYGILGLCKGVAGSVKCTHSGTCSKGKSCSVGTASAILGGRCLGEDMCKYLPPVVKCTGTDTPCADVFGFIGVCNARDECIVATTACTVKDACGPGTLKGICLPGDKCKYTPPAAPCPVTSDTTLACTDNNNYIGTCAGGNSATCSAMNSCTANAACTQGLLKGMCNATNRCQHDPLVAPCVQTWAAGDGCTDSSNFIGMCVGDSSLKTCTLSNKCTNNVGACEEGSLMGMCVDDKKCKYTPPVAPCVLTSIGDAPCTDNAGYIGKCTGTVGSLWCTPSPCTTDGEACTEGVLSGKCLTKKCKYTASIKIEYTVQSAEYKNPVVAKVLTHEDFETHLENTFGSRTSSDQEVTCGEMPTDPNGGSFTAKCNEPAGVCLLGSCPANYKVKGKNDLKCDKDTIQWKGASGTCEKYCPANNSGFGALTSAGELTKEVTNGTLTCRSDFEGDQCSLKCDPKYRVQTPPTRMCEATKTKPAWVGNDGVCEHAVDISASVHVVLKKTDNHYLITKLDDDTFNDTFRDSVSKLTGVLPENVLITKISLVTSAGRRRLTQRSVQVDYSVQVGATDLDKVDGTDSPEDYGSLPVGAALRGIP